MEEVDDGGQDLAVGQDDLLLQLEGGGLRHFLGSLFVVGRTRRGVMLQPTPQFGLDRLLQKREVGTLLFEGTVMTHRSEQNGSTILLILRKPCVDTINCSISMNAQASTGRIYLKRTHFQFEITFC